MAHDDDEAILVRKGLVLRARVVGLRRTRAVVHRDQDWWLRRGLIRPIHEAVAKQHISTTDAKLSLARKWHAQLHASRVRAEVGDLGQARGRHSASGSQHTGKETKAHRCRQVLWKWCEVVVLVRRAAGRSSLSRIKSRHGSVSVLQLVLTGQQGNQRAVSWGNPWKARHNWEGRRKVQRRRRDGRRMPGSITGNDSKEDRSWEVVSI